MAISFPTNVLLLVCPPTHHTYLHLRTFAYGLSPTTFCMANSFYQLSDPNLSITSLKNPSLNALSKTGSPKVKPCFISS